MKTEDDYIEEVKKMIEEDKNEYDEFGDTNITPYIENEIYEVCIGSVKVSGTNILKVAKVAVILAAYNTKDDMVEYNYRKQAVKDIDDAIGVLTRVGINIKKTGENEV